MRWPWQRRAPAPDTTSVDGPAEAGTDGSGDASGTPAQRAAERPSPSGWAFHAPLQRTIAPTMTIRREETSSWAAAWRSPAFTGSMTHLVSGDSSSGVIDGDGGGLVAGTPDHVPTPPAAPQAPAAGDWSRGVDTARRGSLTHAAEAAGMPVLRYPVDSTMPLAPRPEPAVQREVSTTTHDDSVPAADGEAVVADDGAPVDAAGVTTTGSAPEPNPGWVNPDLDGSDGTVVDVPLPAGSPVASRSSSPPVQRSEASGRRLGLGEPLTRTGSSDARDLALRAPVSRPPEGGRPVPPASRASTVAAPSPSQASLAVPASPAPAASAAPPPPAPNQPAPGQAASTPPGPDQPEPDQPAPTPSFGAPAPASSSPSAGPGSPVVARAGAEGGDTPVPAGAGAAAGAGGGGGTGEARGRARGAGSSGEGHDAHPTGAVPDAGTLGARGTSAELEAPATGSPTTVQRAPDQPLRRLPGSSAGPAHATAPSQEGTGAGADSGVVAPPTAVSPGGPADARRGMSRSTGEAPLQRATAGTNDGPDGDAGGDGLGTTRAAQEGNAASVEADDAPVQRSAGLPLDSAPADSAPGDSAPADSARVETTAADAALVDSALIDSALIDSALIGTASTGTTLVGTALTSSASPPTDPADGGRDGHRGARSALSAHATTDLPLQRRSAAPAAETDAAGVDTGPTPSRLAATTAAGGPPPTAEGGVPAAGGTAVQRARGSSTAADAGAEGTQRTGTGTLGRRGVEVRATADAGTGPGNGEVAQRSASPTMPVASAPDRAAPGSLVASVRDLPGGGTSGRDNAAVRDGTVQGDHAGGRSDGASLETVELHGAPPTVSRLTRDTPLTGGPTMTSGPATLPLAANPFPSGEPGDETARGPGAATVSLDRGDDASVVPADIPPLAGAGAGASTSSLTSPGPPVVARATATARPLPWRRPADHSPRSGRTSGAVTSRASSLRVVQRNARAATSSTTLAGRPQPVMTALDVVARPQVTGSAAGGASDVWYQPTWPPGEEQSVQRDVEIGQVTSSPVRRRRPGTLGGHRRRSPQPVPVDAATDVAEPEVAPSDVEQDVGTVTVEDVQTEVAAEPGPETGTSSRGLAMSDKELVRLADALYPQLLRRIRHEVLLDRERRGVRTDRRVP